MEAKLRHMLVAKIGIAQHDLSDPRQVKEELEVEGRKTSVAIEEKHLDRLYESVKQATISGAIFIAPSLLPPQNLPFTIGSR